MEGFKACEVASKVLRSGRPCRGLRRHRSAGATSSTSSPPASSGRAGVVPQKEIDQRADVQALEQEQTVFERSIKQDDALFRLQMAMGWSTFVLAPVTLVALIVYPPLGAALVPLLGVAVWNWRRMLARQGGERTVITKRSHDRN